MGLRDLQERRTLVAAVGVGSRRPLIPVAAAVVVAADQITKSLALDHLRPYQARHVVGPVHWYLTFNTGAAFSVGTGVTPILEAVVVVLIVGLVVFSRKAARTATAPVSVALGMVLGGALSNLGDRLFRHLPVQGGVVDFIRAVTWWPVFNVADASIVIGVILLALTWRSRA
ncbi:MAG: signal peptidase II [Actinomycetota bacterium]|nr:signal peptidase II [Actinomycetota bacterium]